MKLSLFPLNKTLSSRVLEGRKVLPGRYAKLGVLAIFGVFLIPGLATAAKPTRASCAVLVPAEIHVNQPFTAKVVRVPSYPGSWTRPEVQIEVSYPTTAGNEYTQSMEQTIWRYNVTYATETFTVPDPEITGIEVGQQAKIAAVVREPINRKKSRETLCTTATATVYP